MTASLPGALPEVHIPAFHETMTQTEPRRFQKTVAIKATDEDERTATGAALVPNEVDRQRDYLEPAGIEAMFAPDPDDGVMHFKFADDDAELTRNEIIDEAETIGGKEYAAGSWIITRKYHDDELWQLVKDGILTGFSIGGEVSEEVDRAADELPDDITFPAEVDEGPATEIVNGYVAEISDVDIPAVPNADHAAVKSLEKNVVAQADSEDGFVELMEPRGHSEEEARRLWSHLQKTQTDQMTKKTDDPDAASLEDVDDATLGKRFKQWWESIGVSDDDTNSIELADVDPVEAEKALTIAKEGRTLSEANRETLMAAHDAIEATLASDMDYETNRFTDNDEYSFTLSGYEEKKDDKKSADTDDNMTDDELTDKVDALETQLAELTEKLDDSDEDADAQKADEQDDENPLAEKLDELSDQIEKLDDRVDKVAKGSAESDQVGGGAEKNTDDTDESSAFKAALGSH